MEKFKYSYNFKVYICYYYFSFSLKNRYYQFKIVNFKNSYEKSKRELDKTLKVNELKYK